MLCKEVEEKLIDYIDGILDEKDHLAIENHIKHCTSCEEELKELKESIEYINLIDKDIKAPHNLMETVKKEVENKRSLNKKPKKKVGYIALVSIIVTLLMTDVFANESIKTYLEAWKDKGLQESQSIEQLIAEGYGEKVNIISEDKNIKVKIESVIADDINTVLLIEIEDLTGKGKYVPILGDDTIVANGNFKYYSPGYPENFIIDNASIQGSFLLYTPEKNKTRTVLSLDPVGSNYEEIELIINSLKAISEEETRIPRGGRLYYDQVSKDIIEGLWEFKVLVKPSESIVFDINEEMDLNGHKIIFNQLKISPTMTTLTYKFNKRQNKEYILESLLNINIEAKDKIYETKSYGGNRMNSNNYRPTEGRVSFDTMYFEIPNKIKISVDGYDTMVNEEAIIEIDVKKPFPQDFKYLDSTIRVNKVQGDENIIRISMDNLGEKYFERLLFTVLVNGEEYMESQYAAKFIYPDDPKRTHVSSYDILLNNTSIIYDNYPKEGYSVSMRGVKYYDYNPDDIKVDELTLNNTLDDEIKSVIIKINGYKEKKYIEGNLSLKLKKYKQK